MELDLPISAGRAVFAVALAVTVVTARPAAAACLMGPPRVVSGAVIERSSPVSGGCWVWFQGDGGVKSSGLTVFEALCKPGAAGTELRINKTCCDTGRQPGVCDPPAGAESHTVSPLQLTEAMLPQLESALTAVHIAQLAEMGPQAQAAVPALQKALGSERLRSPAAHALLMISDDDTRTPSYAAVCADELGDRGSFCKWRLCSVGPVSPECTNTKEVSQNRWYSALRQRPRQVAELERVAELRADALNPCFTKGKRTGAVEVTVGNDGEVTAVAPDGRVPKPAAACVDAAVRAWRFRPGAAPTTFHVKLAKPH